MPLDDIFARQGAPPPPKTPTSPTLPNGNVVVPAQNRPTPQQNKMARSRSQPGLDRQKSEELYEDTYSRHITKVDLEPKTAPSPRSHGKQFDYPDHAYSNGNVHRDNIYAVPGAESPSYNQRIPPPPRERAPDPPRGRGIPPPPNHAAPDPPSPSNSSGEFVPINTSPDYANVSSGNVQRRNHPHTSKEESPYESSFRPGKNARLSKTPAELPGYKNANNYSGGSDSGHYSDNRNTYSPQRHVMDYEKTNPQQDNVYQNADRFLNDHPNADVIVTADVHSNDTRANRGQYYEPTPDYDEETDTVRFKIHLVLLHKLTQSC